MLVEYMMSWMTPFWIGVYLFVSVTPFILLWKQKAKFAGTKELNEKYWSFARNDIHLWSLPRFVVSFALLGGPIRFLIAWGCVMLLFVISWVVMIGHTPGKKVGKMRTLILTWSIRILVRIIMLCAGIVYISTSHDETKIDFKKYLGPDWKIDPKQTAGIQVANHTCFLDVCTMGYLQFPISMVSGEAVRGLPGIYGIGEAAQNIWMERGGSSEARAKTLREITERQALIEKGVCPTLNIFPEGATTNAKSIIKFKKGAFVGLNAVRPVVYRYSPLTGLEVEQAIVGIPFATFISVCTVMTTLQVDYLPIFKPNEYFWKNHW